MPTTTISRLGDVLVATDFSQDAARALDRALRLPLREGSTVHLLHVIGSGDDEREVEASLREHAAGAARSLSAPPAVCPHVVCGESVAVEVGRLGRAHAVDLIVCGRRGAGGKVGTARLMRISREAELPVLVVTTDAQQPYRCALAAVDLTDASPFVARLAMSVVEGGSRSEVQLTHAAHLPFSAFLGSSARDQLLEEAEARLSRVRELVNGTSEVAVCSRLLEGELMPSLMTEAARIGSDLVVVGSHGRGPLRRALLGSVGASLLQNAGVDVLLNRPLRTEHDLPA